MEAEILGDRQVFRRVERASHPRLHRRGRVDHTFLGGSLEGRAVEVALFEVALPGVRVRIELDER